MQSRHAGWLLALLFTAGQMAAQTPTWSLMPGAPAGTTPRFDDISFVNDLTGWAARSTGGIYKTTDGGNTFTLSRSSVGAYPGTNLTAHFRSILFLSATHGFAGNLGPGSYDTTVTDTNILFETLNGGTNWAVRPGFPETGMKGLCAFYALDSLRIYGGGRVRGPAYFIKSTDGGANWSITNLTAAGVMGGIMDVYFHDATNGFIVGMSTNTFSEDCSTIFYGRIARTTNGGATWQPVATTTNSCCYFWKMAWPSPSVGYVALQQNNSPMIGHVFYKTTDGGTTWTPHIIPFSSIASGMTSFYWQGIGFVSDNEGWAGGDSSTSPYANNFLHTTNGGASWSPVGTSNTLRVNRIRFLRPDYAVASGARLLVYKSPPSPVQILSPRLAGSNFMFTFATQPYAIYTVQWTTNLSAQNWMAFTNFIGSGSSTDVHLSITTAEAQYFRVSRP